MPLNSDGRALGDRLFDLFLFGFGTTKVARGL